MAHDGTANNAAQAQLRLATVELERRLVAGEAVRAEQLFANFPAIAADADMAVELIYTEFVAREGRGERLEPDEFYRRFPQRRDDLERLFEVHALADDGVNGVEYVDERAPAEPIDGPPSDGALPRLGHYLLLKEIARGGMGVVYQARDTRLNRLVALKKIRATGRGGSDDRSRIRAEAELVARLQHPNIVQIFEVGETDDGPYLAMEFVPGGELAGKLAGRLAAPREAAELVETLSRAVHYAHRQNVVHLDLKPANIMLTADGTAKITDFGLGRRHDSAAEAAEPDSVRGTLSYMAPEQVVDAGRGVGPWTDVYALGSILYEMLTGRPPLGREASLDLLTRIATEEPLPPSRLEPKTPRDLETICLKCLAKNSADRYPSAEALADDLRRFLADEPISARPVPAWERGLKWARRRPATAGLVTVIAAAVLVGFAGIAWHNGRLGRELKKSQELQAETERQARLLTERLEFSRRDVYALQLGQAEVAGRRDPGRGLELLEDPERCPADLRDFSWGYLHRLCERERSTSTEFSAPVFCLAVSPDGSRWCAGGGEETKPAEGGEVRVADATSGETQHAWRQTAPVYEAVFAPDGQTLLTACGDRFSKDPGEARLWNTADFSQSVSLAGLSARITAAVFSPDSRRLASAGSDRKIRLWEVATGREIKTLGAHPDGVGALVFSSDGKTLTSASVDGTMKTWNVETGEELSSRRRSGKVWRTLVFSPDGRTLAASDDDYVVTLWDVATLTPRHVLAGHSNRVAAAAFSPDGSHLVTGSDDRTIKLWDIADGREIAALKGHTNRVSAVAFLPDGRSFASAGWDKTVKTWYVAPRQPYASLEGHEAKVVSLAFAPGGKRLATGSIDNTVRLWNVAEKKLEATLVGHRGTIRALGFSPDGKMLVTGSEDKTVKLWDVDTRTVRRTLEVYTHYVIAVAFAPDGKTFATGGHDKTIKIYDSAGELLKTLPAQTEIIRTLAFSHQGDLLASGGDEKTVELWNTATWSRTAVMEGHTSGVNCVAFTEDGKTVVSGSSDRTVKLWDVELGRERMTLSGHTHYVNSAALSSDGQTLATGSGDRWINTPGEVKLWDPVTGQVRVTLQAEGGPVAFDTDGRLLATAELDGTVKLWAAATAEK